MQHYLLLALPTQCRLTILSERDMEKYVSSGHPPHDRTVNKSSSWRVASPSQGVDKQAAGNRDAGGGHEDALKWRLDEVSRAVSELCDDLADEPVPTAFAQSFSSSGEQRLSQQQQREARVVDERLKHRVGHRQPGEGSNKWTLSSPNQQLLQVGVSSSSSKGGSPGVSGNLGRGALHPMNPNTVHDYRLQSLELENSGLKKQITHLRNVKRNEAEKDVQIRSLEMERESLRAELRTKVGILLFLLAICPRVYHSEVRASRKGKERGTIHGTVPIHATSTEMRCSYLRTLTHGFGPIALPCAVSILHAHLRLLRTFHSFNHYALRFGTGVSLPGQFLCLSREPPLSRLQASFHRQSWVTASRCRLERELAEVKELTATISQIMSV